MKHFIVFVFIIGLAGCCDAQQKKSFEKTSKTTTKSNKMKRPSINNRFETLNLEDYKDGLTIEKEWSFSTKSYYDWYEYRKETENEIIGINGNINAGLRYGKTLKNSIYVVSKIYYWKSGYIKSKSIFTQFTNIRLGEEYQFDESGKLIKTIDHDKGWDFSYEDLMAFVKEKYKDKILAYDSKYAFDIKKKKAYDDRNYWELYVKPDIGERTDQGLHSYDLLKIDGITGKILSYQQWTDYYGEPETLRKTIVPDVTIPPSERPSTVYKTIKGKDYTKEEWQTYEQEQYNEHLRKTGRGDLVKPTDKPIAKTDNTKSFLADEDDVKPKKKGFWR